VRGTDEVDATRSEWLVGLMNVVWCGVVVIVWCMCWGAFVQGWPFLPCIPAVRAKAELQKVAADTSAITYPIPTTRDLETTPTTSSTHPRTRPNYCAVMRQD
jgi:hypothetical protein